MSKEMRKAEARGFLATASRTFPNAILYMPPKECPRCSLSSIFIGGRRSTLTRNHLSATQRHKYLRLDVAAALFASSMEQTKSQLANLCCQGPSFERSV